MTDYEAALKAARELVAVLYVGRWEQKRDDPAFVRELDAWEALAKAIGAERYAQHPHSGCVDCLERRVTAKAEADRLAAPYLPEVKA